VGGKKAGKEGGVNGKVSIDEKDVGGGKVSSALRNLSTRGDDQEEKCEISTVVRK
jgi:hypothetical protein